MKNLILAVVFLFGISVTVAANVETKMITVEEILKGDIDEVETINIAELIEEAECDTVICSRTCTYRVNGDGTRTLVGCTEWDCYGVLKAVEL